MPLALTDRQEAILEFLRNNLGMHGPTKIGLAVFPEVSKQLAASMVCASTHRLVALGKINYDAKLGRYGCS